MVSARLFRIVINTQSTEYGIQVYLLRNAIVGFFGLRNEFASVQGNKKRSTQNIQIKKQKKTNDVELLFVNKQKRSHRVDYRAMVKGHKAKKY